jgi:S1-C subfamily serine protease
VVKSRRKIKRGIPKDTVLQIFVFVIMIAFTAFVFYNIVNIYVNQGRQSVYSQSSQENNQIINNQTSIQPEVQLTPQQQCENKGNIWCNGICYNPCASGYKSVCDSRGQRCVKTYTIDDNKNTIVYIRHDVTGCCDSYNQISNLLGGSGSGVIYYINGSTVDVLTSRHVVDCVFAGTCQYPINESITIRTQDGNFYKPNSIWYAPQNLDLAWLQFQTTNNNLTYATIDSGSRSIGDSVTAIGYPAVGLESPEPILQFSITEGRITNVYDLLTYRGTAFRGIESDAITGRGASGGGLFNEDGQLIGIITWGDREQKITIAIDIKVFDAIEYFERCPSGYYSPVEGGCCPYGTISGVDGKCYKPCGKPYSYCPTGSYCCNNQCVSCPSGYYLGTDCLCHSG